MPLRYGVAFLFLYIFDRRFGLLCRIDFWKVNELGKSYYIFLNTAKV